MALPHPDPVYMLPREKGRHKIQSEKATQKVVSLLKVPEAEQLPALIQRGYLVFSIKRYTITHCQGHSTDLNDFTETDYNSL